MIRCMHRHSMSLSFHGSPSDLINCEYLLKESRQNGSKLFPDTCSHLFTQRLVYEIMNKVSYFKMLKSSEK